MWEATYSESAMQRWLSDGSLSDIQAGDCARVALATADPGCECCLWFFLGFLVPHFFSFVRYWDSLELISTEDLALWEEYCPRRVEVGGHHLSHDRFERPSFVDVQSQNLFLTLVPLFRRWRH